MSGKDANEGKLRIRVETDPQYRCLHISGAFGGITPRGDIKVDFISEYKEQPSELLFNLDERGRANLSDPDSVRPQRPDIVRTHHFGMYVSPEHAKSIAEWLMEKAESAMKEREKSET